MTNRIFAIRNFADALKIVQNWKMSAVGKVISLAMSAVLLVEGCNTNNK
jgi:hypothetical protein